METQLKNEEFEEKICKKIGQLTRVIFYLNVKNEDQESLIKQMTKSYQEEIDQAVVDANKLAEKNSQKNKLIEKIENVRSNMKQIEMKIQKENNDNVKLIKSLERDIANSQEIEQLELNQENQKEEIRRLVEMISNFESILKVNQSNLQRKIQMKNEQFETYTKENNKKYQKWVQFILANYSGSIKRRWT